LVIFEEQESRDTPGDGEREQRRADTDSQAATDPRRSAGIGRNLFFCGVRILGGRWAWGYC
jgi:hypothetical protein